jgi:hypothetical protein
MSFAIVAVHSHPKETLDQQKAFLHDRIIPMIESQPGFLRGFWGFNAAARVSNSYIVFSNEGEARRVAALIQDESSKPNPFDVRPLSVTVVELLGEAHTSRA